MRRIARTVYAPVAGIALALGLAGCSSLAEPEMPQGRLEVPGATPGAGTEEQFEASDGASLGYTAYRAPRARVALVYLHGIESHGGWFSLAAERLQDRGLDVYCLDRRGSGINRENRGFPSGHMKSYQTLVADIRAFIGGIEGRYEAVYLVGLSWGGKLALRYALDHQDDLEGIILITPGLKAIVDMTLPQKLRIVLADRLSPTHRLPTPIEPEMFTRTPVYLDYIRRDPLRLREATARFFAETARLDASNERDMPGNTVPVLVFLASDDRIIDNQATRKMLELGAQREFSLLEYEGQTHSIQFDAVDRMVSDISLWVEDRRRP